MGLPFDGIEIDLLMDGLTAMQVASAAWGNSFLKQAPREESFQKWSNFMISQHLKEKAEQARRDGYVVFNVSAESPMRLDHIIQLVQDLFPNHKLDQLAITQADEDQFVVAAELGIGTKTN